LAGGFGGSHVRMQSRSRKLLAIVLGLSLFAAGCGDDDDTGGEGTDEGTEEEASDTAPGGEFVDLGTVVGDPLEHIDPALNVLLDGFQITNALFDGLTEIDFTDPDNPELKGLVAESWEANEDATEFTFTIKDGLEFSNGEPVLPSSFVRAWERASDPDFAGQYAYLFNFLEGGAEKLDGTAETISGVTADDEAMTLTTVLAEPYANWPTVAGFQLFWPVPAEVDELADQNDWQNGLMASNGPYKLESPRSTEEIVLVKNESWAGDINGETWDDRLDRITFRTQADIDTSYNAFEAGEGDNASIPPGRWGAASEDHQNTIGQSLGTRYFEIKWDHPVVGGPENVKLRQAILQAINREEINEAIYNGTATEATSVIPPGIPGFTEDICEYCTYDPEAAQAAYEEWQAAGNELTEPIKIQLDAGRGYEDTVATMVSNLEAVGIPAVAEPLDAETYFTLLGDGACVICRSGWYADYPTADNFTFDLFGTEAIGGNNHGFYTNPQFDELIAQAKATTDEAEASRLYHDAEDLLLNQDIAVLPTLYYSLDYVYSDDVARFPVTKLGLILWEQVAFRA
jgi:oligopeptide transport system substrate-binding protein